MDSGDDGRDPWEREQEQEEQEQEEKQEQEQPPSEEEYEEQEQEEQEQEEKQEQEQEEQEQKPPAVGSDLLPVTPALLPVLENTTPERRQRVEPTALTPPAVVVATLLAKAPKLKRLTRKTTVPDYVCPMATRPFVDLTPSVFEYSEVWLSQHFYRRLCGQQQYHWVYDRLRAFYLKKVHPLTLTKKGLADYEQLSGVERQKEGRRAFTDLDSSRRAQVAVAWMKASVPPAHIAPMIEEQFISHAGGGVSTRTKTKGVLLTWMLPANTGSASKVVADGEPTALGEVVRRLRASADVQSVWKDVQLHAQVCLRLAGASDVAVCLEVCPDTWEEGRVLKLHMHAFLKSSGSDLRVRNLIPFAFSGVKPNASLTIGGMPVATNGRSSWSGFFYCCISDKTGTLFSQATKVPFKGYLVQPNWILNLVQNKKLETDVAKALLVQCASASRHIKELELHEAHLEEEAVKHAQEAASRLLQGSLKPQKTYPAVEIFKRQFDQAIHRYKFLVLSGPSRVGKTAFARSLCDPGCETLEINCASGAEPELRAYRLRKHGLILFDEIVASQVACQRKLFQAQSAPVQLGCSATNCHSYGVFVWRKKMVLASNNWESSLTLLSDPDREWVDANSIVVSVMEPMWQE